MHAFAFAAVAQMLQLVPKPTRVVEIGSYDINGSIRHLFNGASFTGIDVVPGPGVDVVADGATYQPDEAPDCVVCCEVLEHAPNADAIVANAGWMVQRGGSVLVTCATGSRLPHSAIDGANLREGEFYRNVPKDDLVAWFKAAGLRVVDVLDRPDVGDLYVCGVKP